MSIGLWIQGELVIMATDLAEFIGAALGLYLLFGIPMLPAALITAAGSFIILEFQRRGFRPLEAIITGMIFIVVIAFGIQVLCKTRIKSPSFRTIYSKIQGVDSILLAAGILGATVMPHAIYLHSALTQRRVVGTTDEQKKRFFVSNLSILLLQWLLLEQLMQVC